MNVLLEAIVEGWGWKLGEPVAIIATNRFGNAIVRNNSHRQPMRVYAANLIASSASRTIRRISGWSFMIRAVTDRNRPLWFASL
jgi:hypothetical protein